MTCGSPANRMSFCDSFLARNGSTWTSAPPAKAGGGMLLSQCHAEAPPAWPSGM
jgi:hypothetical protein